MFVELYTKCNRLNYITISKRRIRLTELVTFIIKSFIGHFYKMLCLKSQAVVSVCANSVNMPICLLGLGPVKTQTGLLSHRS